MAKWQTQEQVQRQEASADENRQRLTRNITTRAILQGRFPPKFLIYTRKEASNGTTVCEMLYPEEVAGRVVFASSRFNLEIGQFYYISYKDNTITIKKITNEERIRKYQQVRAKLFPTVQIVHTTDEADEL